LPATDNNKLKEVETLIRRIYMLRIMEINKFGLHEYLKKWWNYEEKKFLVAINMIFNKCYSLCL